MPEGLRAENRPGDVIAAALKLGRLAVGDEEKAVTDDGKAKKRSEIAKQAAAKHWGAKK